MPATPPERIELGPLVVRRETADDAEAIADAIASNIPRLTPWMEWAVSDAAQVQTQRVRIANSIAQWDSGTVFDYLVTDRSEAKVLGKSGLRRSGTGVMEIGYWLTEAAEGRGVMTAVAAALTTVAAGLQSTKRVEIHCDAANIRSRAIPARLGYRLDRTVDHPITTSHQTGRQMIWVYDALP
ncbi:GNAT family N-acetyltransferase [Rhodococcoides yunnanense]|uniref:GNAT family N-acetyltransferase n=1 Tax=Rhodococcoides yunnanense TaxID=278209 RepID=UPI0009328838|nr:GNAT family N-acetyltransferase [Rhodococcus yunnanensis]